MLDLGGLLISLLITVALCASFVLGKHLGAEQERDRAARTRRNPRASRLGPHAS